MHILIVINSYHTLNIAVVNQDSWTLQNCIYKHHACVITLCRYMCNMDI